MKQTDRLEDYGSVKEYLAKIPVLRDLPEADQLRLVEQSTHHSYEKDDTVFQEGTPVHTVVVIRSGRIKLVRYDADGKEHLLDILHDGDAVWETLFTDSHVYPYSGICLAETHLCEFSTDLFLQILRENPNTAFELISILSNNLMEANEKLTLVGVKEPVCRLAQFLLFKDKTCVTPEVMMKLDDIAASIDLRPETVSRAIRELEKQNLILRTGQGRIRILDREGLARLSGTPLPGD